MRIWPRRAREEEPVRRESNEQRQVRELSAAVVTKVRTALDVLDNIAAMKEQQNGTH